MEAKIKTQGNQRYSSYILSLTWPEKEALCKEWRNSGLSKVKFCKQKDINVATFSGWCFKLWPNGLSASDDLFCPVNIMDIKPNTNDSIVLEVSFPNAVIARIKATTGQFSYLLRELIDATSVIR